MMVAPAYLSATPTNDPDQIATKQKIRELEQRLLEQEKLLREGSGERPSWWGRVRVGGVVAVDMVGHEPFQGESTSDFLVSTAALGMGASVNEQVDAEIAFLYEEDETDLELDVAVVRYRFHDQPWSVKAGQFYLPFGSYESNLISKPLTLLMAEMRETALMLSYEAESVSANVFAFNGDINVDGEDRIDTWGANLNYTYASQPYSFVAHASYTNNMADSGGLQDAVSSPALDDASAGMVLGLGMHAEPYHFVAEYVQTLDAFAPDILAFDGKGAEPSVWNLELGYAFVVAEQQSMVVLGCQETGDALALEMPETRLSVAWNFYLKETSTLSFEWMGDEDYSASVGGTGEGAQTFKVRLAVEF